MSAGKVFLGVLAGLAAGTVLGILIAPDKGSITRKKIARKSEDYADAVRDKFNGLVDGISTKFGEMKEEVSELAEKGKVRVREAASTWSARSTSPASLVWGRGPG